MVIHSKSGGKSKKEASANEKNTNFNETDKINLSPRFAEGLADPNTGAKDWLTDKNTYDFSVRATNNGSMTQDTFFDFCLHFIKHLPNGQGKGGDPHILFLDGHASRWNLQAINLLMSNNVFPFFLPSHTSVWTQPNDNGTNLRMHKSVEDAIKKLRVFGQKANVSMFNVVIRTAWKDFMERERLELLHTKANTTTSAWRVTGLYPFNPNPEAWKNVLSTLGVLNREMRRDVATGEINKSATEYEITTIKNAEKLTTGEEACIRRGMPEGSSVIESGLHHVRAMIARWRENGRPPSTPEPARPEELVSLKFLQLVERAKNHEEIMKRVSNIVKSEDIQYKEESTQILSCTPLTRSVEIIYTATNQLCDGEEKEGGMPNEGVFVKHSGSATRKKNGKFRIQLVDDEEWIVDEADLLDVSKFQIKRPKGGGSSEEREVWNKKTKRMSKRKEQHMIDLRKEDAKKHRRNVIELRKKEISEAISEGEFDVQLLNNFEELVCKPLEYTSRDGYKVYATHDYSTCTSMMALKAIDNIAGTKRKNDELSQLNKKRARLNADGSNRKTSRTPNTTRGDDGINIKMKLATDATITNKDTRDKDMKAAKKSIVGMEKALTGWTAVETKVAAAAAAAGLEVKAPELWTMTTGRWKADDRKIFLKLCVPDSGVISKSEEVQLSVLVEHDVTYLKLMSCKETMTTKLTALRNRLSQLEADASNETNDVCEVDVSDDEERLIDEDFLA